MQVFSIGGSRAPRQRWDNERIAPSRRLSPIFEAATARSDLTDLIESAGRVEYDHTHASRGEFASAARETLASWGALPPAFVDRISNENTGAGRRHPIGECKPPATDPPILFEREQYWAALRGARYDHDPTAIEGDGTRSAVFSLGIRDVTGLSTDYSGVNLISLRGDSEDYVVLAEDRDRWFAYDHKAKVAYNALTWLLVEAGELLDDRANRTLGEAIARSGGE